MSFHRLIFLVALVAPSALAADWPIHRGNATQTGVSDEKLPDALGIRWEFKTKNAIEGSPVIADGIIYVGSADKHLYAIDLKTGALKWKTPGDGPLFSYGMVVFDQTLNKLRPRNLMGIITSSPGVKGDRIYTGNADGKFFCLNRDTGNVIWTFDTDGQITAAPNFDGDNVLIASQDSVLYCLDKDGKKVWDFRIEG